MNNCDTCQRKNICHINDYIPENATNRITWCWQYRPMSEKKKLYLTKYVAENSGGVERIERLFDYQCEVVIIPDAYETLAQRSD